MNTIGSYLKSVRLKRKISIKKLEDITKIKSSFIEYIENEQWDKLPEGAIVGGFVKSIASSLKTDVKQASALFRRDYSKKKININPSPALRDKFTWGPKITFFALSFCVVITIFSYLIFQYISFNSSPKLIVFEPTEGQLVNNPVSVSGTTKSNVALTVNGQPVIVEDDGNFETKIEIEEAETQIEIKAKSVSGKDTIVIRKIIIKK